MALDGTRPADSRAMRSIATMVVLLLGCKAAPAIERAPKLEQSPRVVDACLTDDNVAPTLHEQQLLAESLDPDARTTLSFSSCRKRIYWRGDEQIFVWMATDSSIHGRLQLSKQRATASPQCLQNTMSLAGKLVPWRVALYAADCCVGDGGECAEGVDAGCDAGQRG